MTMTPHERELLGSLSHELRTPLNGIIGFAALMHDAKVGPVSPEHKEYLGDILISARHLLLLINNLLDLAQLESGKVEFHPETIDPGVLATDVRDSLHALAVQRRITVRVEVDRAVGTVVADAEKLTQVLANYVSSALRCTPEEGRVVIRLDPEGDDQFRVEVAAEGAPLPNDGATTLALAFARQVVEAQGGRAGVRSAPTEGRVFFAVLPRTPDRYMPR